MAQSVRRAKVDAAGARKIYEELGELTESELIYLHHGNTDHTRKSYFTNIYGHHASWIARRIYTAWVSKHKCGARCNL